MLGERYFCLQGWCKLQKNWQENKVRFSQHNTMVVTYQLIFLEALKLKYLAMTLAG
jgi:hypothetical protein